MSKIGVISDIHGNLPALEKALDILKSEGAERIFVCGDIVGYGKSPNECCDRIRALECPVTAGNHDWAVAGMTEYRTTHTIRAIQGIDYTKKVISEENLKWLQSLPLHHKEDDMEFVHASLVKAEHWHYLSRRHSFSDSAWHDVKNNFEVLKGQICFVGHSHQPTIFLEKRWGRIKTVYPKGDFYDLKGRRAIVDTGSIGLPRDNSEKSSLVIFDTENRRVYFKQFTLNDKPIQGAEAENKDLSWWERLKRSMSIRR